MQLTADAQTRNPQTVKELYTMSQGENLLTTKDVSDLLDMPIRSVQAHAFELGGKRRRNGRHYRYTRKDVLIGAIELGLDLPPDLKDEADRLRAEAMQTD